MSRSIVRDILEALEVQHINELMDDGKHYIIEVCRRITSENKQRIKELDAENVKLRICLWNLAADPDHVKGMANRIEELEAQLEAARQKANEYLLPDDMYLPDEREQCQHDLAETIVAALQGEKDE